MADSEPLGDLAGRLAAWGTGLRMDAIPAEVVRAARRAVLDVTGCALAGATTPLARATRTNAPRLYAAGRCHLMGGSGSLTPVGAAFVNGVAANALEFDPTLAAGRIHAAAVVFPAILAATEATDGRPTDMMSGFIAGLEIAGLMGRAVATALTGRGWSPSAVAGLIGATVGAARAFRLDAATAGHALRLALVRGMALAIGDGGGVRALALAGLAEEAVRACVFANDGVIGPAQALEGPGGALAVLAGPKPKGVAAPWKTLGETWACVDPGLSFKLHPMASATLPAIEETARLLASHGIASSRVRRVVCTVSPEVAARLIRDRPLTQPQAQHSLGFGIGCLLTFGQLNVGHLRGPVLEGPGLAEAMDKVTVEAADPETGLDADVTVFANHPFAARVTIESQDREAVSGICLSPLGSADRPLSDAQIEAKFLSNARLGGLEDSKATLMARKIWDLPG